MPYIGFLFININLNNPGFSRLQLKSILIKLYSSLRIFQRYEFPWNVFENIFGDAIVIIKIVALELWRKPALTVI